ncbi:amino acid permease [Saccharibacter sp. 17.LH.SD]|uniref:amino acid permease n=1 Tax=Saccharibacter sp. 17.LH.SD TaxID=2689393 RepID=UPI0013710BD7|nr:amino acid permease [Saccharibacter sp. 17.LH.SD]MXV45043.1 amino acid permease [Saccharibacter sp. 17.LH.SD]
MAVEQQSGNHRLMAFHVAMISIGGIIGAGLFVGTSATIAASGPAVLLSYLGAGVIVWLVMRLLGGLAVGARGRGSFISHIYRHIGPRSAFVTGWGYAFLWAVTAGAQAVAGGLIVQDLCGLSPLVGALLFVVVAWGINRLSLRHYGQAEAGLSVLKLVFLGGFIALGIGWLAYSGHPVNEAVRMMTSHGGFFARGGWAVLGAIPMIVQTFTGCEIAVVAATDSDRPVRNIVKTVRWLPLQVLFFYAGSVLVIISLIPWNAVKVGHSPFLTVMQVLHVPFAEWAAVAVTLVAVLSCLNSAVYVVSRTMKELGELNLAPSILTQESRRQVPVWSLRLTTFLELVIIAAAVGSPEAVYPILLGSSGGLILFIYMLVAIAYWRSHAVSKRGGINSWIALVVSLLIPALGALLLVIPGSWTDTLLSLGAVLLLALIGQAVIMVRRPSLVGGVARSRR